MEFRRCYISRCYPHQLTGGFKAKSDIEEIMRQNGFYNLGLPQKINNNKIYIFIYNLLSYIIAAFSIKKNDIIVLQYPLKKYFYLLSLIAKIKNANTIVLIHDLGCFRRKKLNLEKERKRLSKTHHLIVLSDKMKEFVLQNEYKQTVSVLHLWDYINNTTAQERICYQTGRPQVLVVGKFSNNLSSYIYELINNSNDLDFEVYGQGLDINLINNQNQLIYNGLQESSLIIQNTKAHYGLLWYGSKLNDMTAPYGEYLKINTSHKTSLYILAHLPLIVWSKSSIAKFIKENKIGVCVDSLVDLEEVLNNISEKDYVEMCENTKQIANKIKQGHYFLNAYFEGEKEIKKQLNKRKL